MEVGNRSAKSSIYGDIFLNGYVVLFVVVVAAAAAAAVSVVVIVCCCCFGSFFCVAVVGWLLVGCWFVCFVGLFACRFGWGWVWGGAEAGLLWK